jgi:protein-arginine kinase activator protein McsA
MKQEEFIKRCIDTHGERYDYSLTEYVGIHKKVKVICPEHGEFHQRADHHRSGSGCPKCSGQHRPNTREIIEQFKEVHSEFYDYSKVKYKKSHEKVIIICPDHGEFKITASHHKRGRGCNKCGTDSMAEKRTLDQNTFINRCIQTHGNKYDYSKTEYKKAKEKVVIICPEHGEFEQTADDHLRGKGCRFCKKSKGEKKVKKILTENDINFQEQFMFNDCRNKLPLPFDFYLPDHNICIEYNGIQHYRPVEYFGGEENFEKQKKRDRIKHDYCRDNDINLLVIRYDECIETKVNEIRKEA